MILRDITNDSIATNYMKFSVPYANCIVLHYCDL